ncbi:protein PRRC1 [Aplysia californica]|uniref:Protein PRRC1 n=1 Tax=Aplysia californica TaxID=6500 RepID=A0ABM1VY16_APLCA|nr:protein PRRC1 [Aplysia californica]
MMMEEACEEQPEMVSHEEAVQAEKEATASLPPSVGTTPPKVQVPPTLEAPSPLPAFLTKTTSSSPGTPQTPVTKSSTPSQPVRSPVSSAAPESPQIPHEGKSEVPPPQPAPEQEIVKPQGGGQGLFGWISGNSLVNKMVEKTKSSMESVITTLDPGMKQVINSGGDVEVAVTSTKDNKVVPVREAFQSVFGKATVTGKASQATTAAQPVGFTAGLKGAEERISNLRKSGSVPDGQTVVSVEGFIVEILPDRWFEMSCLVLKDPSHGIELQTFSQPTLIPAEYVLKAQDKTPSDYPLKWAGLAVTIGEVIEEAQPHIGHADWQMVLSGVSRRQSLLLAAQSLAFMYKERLPTSFVS